MQGKGGDLCEVLESMRQIIIGSGPCYENEEYALLYISSSLFAYSLQLHYLLFIYILCVKQIYFIKIFSILVVGAKLNISFSKHQFFSDH